MYTSLHTIKKVPVKNVSSKSQRSPTAHVPWRHGIEVAAQHDGGVVPRGGALFARRGAELGRGVGLQRVQLLAVLGQKRLDALQEVAALHKDTEKGNQSMMMSTCTIRRTQGGWKGYQHVPERT